MIRFQWNALRAGDHVRVHVDGGLEDGTVVLVDSLTGSNGVGIRIAGPEGEDVVRWPSRLAVHDSDGSVDEPCGRCGAREASARREP